MKRRSGFTLVELLVVIAIIALLVSILMPALGRVRELARRVQCSSQTSNVGKAIAMYTNEYRDSYPTVSTATNTNWRFCNPVYTQQAYLEQDAQASTVRASYNRWCTEASVNWAATPTIGGSLYLLCRYGDVAPKNFVCPSVDSARSRDMSLDVGVAMTFTQSSTKPILSYKDCFDFSTMNACNYSYQNPAGQGLPTATSESGLAVYADKNWSCDNGLGDNDVNPNCSTQPYWGTTTATDINKFRQEAIFTDNDDSDVRFTNQHNNSKNHDTDTQNVLFAGYNVERCDDPCVGISSDNIYTKWLSATATPIQKARGLWGSAQNTYAVLSILKEKDSFLGN